MRRIHCEDITDAVSRLAVSACTELNDDMLDAFHRSARLEESPSGKEIFARLLENADIARNRGIPLCQDTGTAIVFIEMGQDAHVVGGSIQEAVHEGVRRGYKDGYLRKSVCDPLTRENTQDNTPAVIHFDIVPGDAFKLTVVPKGGGGEMMSALTMLIPAAGEEGMLDFIVEQVKAAGAKPCPPTIIGVGIGGTFEQTALLAKKALLRPVGSRNPDPRLDRLETTLLERINRLGIGPQGMGGRITSLAVFINAMPCHIASIPVAVNIQCHSARHKEIEL